MLVAWQMDSPGGAQVEGGEGWVPIRPSINALPSSPPPTQLIIMEIRNKDGSWPSTQLRVV